MVSEWRRNQSDFVDPHGALAVNDKIQSYIIRVFTLLEEEGCFLPSPLHRPGEGRVERPRKEFSFFRKTAPHLKVRPALQVFGS